MAAAPQKPNQPLIDWMRSAQEVHDLVAASTLPGPGAVTDVFGPRTILWRLGIGGFGGHDTFPGMVELTERSVIVYCGDDKPVEVLLAQPEGQSAGALSASDFLVWLKKRSVA